MRLLIPSIALFMNDSITPIVELKIAFAAPVTVQSILVKVAVNVVDPSPENQEVSDCHIEMTEFFSPVHHSVAFVDIDVHRFPRNVDIAVNIVVAFSLIAHHISEAAREIAHHIALHFVASQSINPSHQVVTLHQSWDHNSK